nr:peptidyl-tRNA hydrolase ICT1, mitochondrial isoform X2 [Oryctolagus cuniculus]
MSSQPDSCFLGGASGRHSRELDWKRSSRDSNRHPNRMLVLQAAAVPTMPQRRPWEDAKQAGGDIPLDRLTISYCRSSGPGGQHVNKVNSKAEVRFHLATADWIAEPVRGKIAVTHKNKINRCGELIVTSESSRYQFRNLADCLRKIRALIAEASQTPEEPSKEDAQLWKARIESRNRERLRQKRAHSALKASRRADVD